MFAIHLTGSSSFSVSDQYLPENMTSKSWYSRGHIKTKLLTCWSHSFSFSFSNLLTSRHSVSHLTRVPSYPILPDPTPPCPTVPGRLVLSPHSYGHDPSKAYMHASNFPANMAVTWACLWADLRATGPAVLLGEWGGLLDKVPPAMGASLCIPVQYPCKRCPCMGSQVRQG